MRKIKMEKIAEIIRLHFKLDLSVRQTSSALNVSRSSVGDYCQKFKYLNLDVDDFLKLSIEKQEELLFPKTPNISQLDNKKVLPDCNYLHNELKKRKKTGITLALLHLNDGINGFLCEVKNAKDKMEKMINLTSDERLAMGKAGREKMIKEFDESIVISKLIK